MSMKDKEIRRVKFKAQNPSKRETEKGKNYFTDPSGRNTSWRKKGRFAVE